MNTNNYNFRVAIHCMTYNHKPFIRQCLDGFVMQKTDFPFVAIVVDDASTDNEQEVLWDFINNELDPSSLQKDETDDYVRLVSPHKTNNNCFFAVYFLEYNHYSIRKAKSPYLKDLEDSAKYIALCEGDDYWTDPYKLQKQVDYMEAHPDCSLVCSRTAMYSEKQKRIIGEKYWYNHNQKLKTKEIIRRGGGAIPTVSVIYRKEIKDYYPEYCKRCATGDHPLQLMSAVKGYVFYLNDLTCVYRVHNSQSWIGRQKRRVADTARLKTLHSIIDMLKGFAKDYPQYRHAFKDRIAMYILNELPNRYENETALDTFKESFKNEIKEFRPWWRIDLYLRTTRIPVLKKYYYYAKRIYCKYFSRIIRY